MAKKHLIVLIFVGLVIISALFIPLRQVRVVSLGVDSFATHRVIPKNGWLEQEVTLQGTLTDVGAIIVPLKANGKGSDVTVRISDMSDRILAQAIIDGNTIKDDTFALAHLHEPVGVASQNVKIQFQSSDSNNTGNLGLRFDPNNGTRLENGQNRTGTYAIELIENVQTFRSITMSLFFHQDRFVKLILVLAITLLIWATVYFRDIWSISTNHERKYQIAALLFLALIAFASRITVLNHLGGVSGGDAYNYLDISKSLAHGENPFTSKRLPGYPALLIPSLVSPQGDPIYTMRILQILSAVGIILLLPTLAIRLGLPWGTGFLASVLLTISKDFFITSLRPEPYTFYGLLLLATIILYLSHEKLWQRLLFGFLLGYTAMTRQEGFLLAVVFGLAFVVELIRNGLINKNWQNAVRSAMQLFLPALLIVMPFFLHNTLVYKNPLFVPYFEGERLQIVDSFLALQDSLGATWGVLGSMYKPSWDELTRVSFDRPLFWGLLTYALLLATVPLLKKRLLVPLMTGVIVSALLVPLYGSYAFMSSGGLFSDFITTLFAALLLPALIAFIIQTKWRGVLLVIIMLSQIMIATWFHPFAKHFQQSIPLVLFVVAVWLTGFKSIVPIRTQWLKIVPSIPAIAFLFVLLLSSTILWINRGIAIDDQNESSALDSVLYRALQVARKQPGPIGLDQGYTPARTFFSDTAYYFPDEDKPSPQLEQTWLKTNRIRILVTTNNNHVFSTPNSDWQLLAHFKSQSKGDKLYESSVYLLPL